MPPTKDGCVPVATITLTRILSCACLGPIFGHIEKKRQAGSTNPAALAARPRCYGRNDKKERSRKQGQWPAPRSTTPLATSISPSEHGRFPVPGANVDPSLGSCLGPVAGPPSLSSNVVVGSATSFSEALRDTTLAAATPQLESADLGGDPHCLPRYFTKQAGHRAFETDKMKPLSKTFCQRIARRD